MSNMTSNQAVRMPETFPGEFADLTVIIPTLNEAASIGILITSLARLYPGCSIIVADDMSSDGTQDAVRACASRSNERVTLLERQDAVDRGITASVLDAISICRTEYFVVIDADLQHPPERAGDLVSALRMGYPLAVGIREPFHETHSVNRVLMSSAANRLARCYLRRRKLAVADPMSGFFGARTAWFKYIAGPNLSRFEPAGYKVLFDFLRVAPSDAPIAEVPFRFGERPGGQSKLRMKHAALFLRSLLN